MPEPHDHINTLESALERVLSNFRRALAQGSVRDAAETIAEAVAALRISDGNTESSRHGSDAGTEVSDASATTAPVPVHDPQRRGDDNDVNGDPGQRRPDADPVAEVIAAADEMDRILNEATATDVPPLPVIARWGNGALTPAEQALADLIDQEWIASCYARTGEDPGAIAVRAMRDPLNGPVVDTWWAETKDGER